MFDFLPAKKRSRNNSSWSLNQLEPRIMLDGDACPAATVAPNSLPVETTSNSAHPALTQNLVFVDAGVEDASLLLSEITEDAEVILLDPHAGIEQITNELRSRTNVSSIHLVTHGSQGAIQLGNQSFDAAALKELAPQLRTWSNSLTTSADILLYGCNVAQGKTGQHFVQQLAKVTGADVAASIDVTGAKKNAANWELEEVVGELENQIVFSVNVRERYSSTLATITFDNLSQGSQGNSFVTDGFRFADGGWGSEDLSVFGTNQGYASNVLQPLRYGRTVTIEKADGQAFDLTSFDYAAGRFSSANASVTGTRSDGSQITSSFASASKSLQTLDLNWTDLTNVVIDFRAGSNQVFGSIDNVNIDTGSPPNAVLAVSGSQSVAESGGSVTVNVTRSGNTATAVSVDYLTVNGSAVAGQDFAARSGTLSFAAGQTTRSITVPITDDSSQESNESFSVRIRNASAGASISDANSSITILDNDAPTGPSSDVDFEGLAVGLQGSSVTVDDFRFSDVGSGSGDPLRVYGPEAGYDSQVLHANNWNRAIRVQRVDGQTFDLSSFDYGAGRWNTLTDAIVTGTRADGTTVTSSFSTTTKSLQTLSLNWTGLTEVLIDFRAGATRAYGALDNFSFGGGTNTPGTVALGTGQININEGAGNATVTVTRTGNTDGTVTVDYATVQTGAAGAGTDYTNASGTLTFNPGVTSRSFAVPINDDGNPESNESFTVTIDNLTGNATLSAPRTAVVTIVDNDTAYPNFPNFADVGQLSVNGGASIGNNQLRLTSATNFDAGSAFFTVPIDFNSTTSFETDFRFRINGGQGAGGADGLAFVIQGNTSTAIGGSAQNLGYGGIQNSVAVEFDTYQNVFDPNDNHVSVLTNGDVENPLQSNLPVVDLNGGSTVYAWVDYNGSSDLMAVYIAGTATKPETPTLLQQVDVAQLVGSQAFIGFTGATGGLNNVHRVLSWDYQPTIPVITPPGNDLTEDVLVVGLNQPTAIDWSDDLQNMLVAQKDGVVRVVRNGTLLSTPFIDISAQVNNVRDRGLLDLAIHPDFENNPYVYLLFTYDPPEVFGNTGNAAPDGVGNRAGRLIRVTANAATNYTTAIPGSEVVLVGTNSTWDNFNGFANSTNDFSEPPAGIDPNGGLPDGVNIRDFVASDSESHTIGGVEFGTDGMLYVSIGDGTSYNQVDPRTVRVQDIDNLSGKILRIDPLTGQGLSDNPFYNGDPDANRSRVYQYGLRNPFRITIDPLTNDLYIGDVGWGSWEEINRAGPGANFGWPYYEGGSGTSIQQPGYGTLAEAQAFYASGQSVDAPIFALNHSTDGVNAIVMGDVYRGSTYPAEYQGDVFVNDANNGTVRNLNFDADGNFVDAEIFTTGAEFYVQIVQGPDGNLFFVDLFGGRIGRWLFE